MPWAPLGPRAELEDTEGTQTQALVTVHDHTCMIIHNRCRTGPGTLALGGQTEGPLSEQGPGMCGIWETAITEGFAETLIQKVTQLSHRASTF